MLIVTWWFGLVGVIASALNLKHPARKSQAKVLLWLGVVSQVLLLLGVAFVVLMSIALNA